LAESYGEEPDLKELISEHEALRREILHNETVIMQTVTSTMAIVTAMMGAAFSNVVENEMAKSFLFFAAESVVFVAMMQSLDKLRLIYLTASYLRVFTEAKLHHLKWETRLSEFRKLQPKKGYRGLIDNQLWGYSFIALINFAWGAYYAVKAAQSSPMAAQASPITVVLLVCGLILTIYLIVNARINCNNYVYRHVETRCSSF
jgi:FtsH-binding integral membrane protein